MYKIIEYYINLIMWTILLIWTFLIDLKMLLKTIYSCTLLPWIPNKNIVVINLIEL